VASNRDKALARKAGKRAFGDPTVAEHGIDACPFPEGTDERAEWLAGLAEAIDEAPDPADLRKALKDAGA
jgi:ribosome modulation factor